jgi:hypothetical protein
MSFSGMLNLLLLSALVVLLDCRAKLDSMSSLETVTAFQSQQGNTGRFQLASSDIHGLNSMIRIHSLRLSSIKADLAKLLGARRASISVGRASISVGRASISVGRVSVSVHFLKAFGVWVLGFQ